MSENTIRLGYVGLGNIGGPMATSLAKWEGGMTVFDLSDDAVAKLVDAGAAKADSLADLASNADIIGICVLNDAQVRTVVSGEGGLLSTAAPGTIIAIHSTIGPQTAIDLAAEASEKGVTVLDAPDFRGAIAAQSGRLAVMVGGPREAYTRLKEPYKLTAEMLIHAGDEVGAGTKMKLAQPTAFHCLHSHRRGLPAGRGRRHRHHQAGQGGPAHRLDTGGAGSIMLRENTAPIEADNFWYGIFAPVRTR